MSLTLQPCIMFSAPACSLQTRHGLYLLPCAALIHWTRTLTPPPKRTLQNVAKGAKGYVPPPAKTECPKSDLELSRFLTVAVPIFGAKDAPCRMQDFVFKKLKLISGGRDSRTPAAREETTRVPCAQCHCASSAGYGPGAI